MNTLKTYALWGLPILLGVLGAVRIAVALPDRATKYDFVHYYISSRLLLEGKPPYETPLEPYCRAYGFEYRELIGSATNPPLLLWLFAPVACLPPKLAFAVCVAVQFASLAAVLLLTRSLLAPQLTPYGLVVLSGLALWSMTVYDHFCFSQIQLQLSALLLFALWLRCRRRHTAASLCVAVAALIKIFPVVLLPWFLLGGERDWTAKARSGAVVALAGGAALWLTGVDLWRDWAKHGLPVVEQNVISPFGGYSLPAFVTKVGYVLHNLQPSSEAQEGIRSARTIASLTVILLGYLGCCFCRGQAFRQYSILLLAMLLSSLTCWAHYFVFLIFPAAYALVHAVAHKAHRHVFVLAGCLIPLAMSPNVETILLYVFVGLAQLLDAMPQSPAGRMAAAYAVTFAPLYCLSTLAIWCLAIPESVSGCVTLASSGQD